LKVSGVFGLLKSSDWRADGRVRQAPPGIFYQHTLRVRGVDVDRATTSQSLSKDDLIEFCRSYLHANSPDYSQGQALLRFLYLDRDLPSKLHYHQIGDKSEFYHNTFLSIPFVLGCVGEVPADAAIGGLGFNTFIDACPHFFDWNADETQSKFDALFENPDERMATWGESFHTDMAMQIVRLTFGHNIFTTDGGRIGWGPPRMRVSDLVCIIFGCGLPVVLRRVEGDIYHYISPCFVVGIMAGEAVEGIHADSERIQAFNII